MLRRSVAVALVATLAIPIVDLEACGDKFLRAGRSTRMKSYAAVYPAVILLYLSPTANPAVVSEWQKMLKQAGHKPHVVVRPANLSQTVASGVYDLVITDYDTAAKARTEIMSTVSKPEVLPVLNGSGGALVNRARTEFEHFIQPDMEPRQALAEIDHLMEARLKAAPSPAN